MSDRKSRQLLDKVYFDIRLLSPAIQHQKYARKRIKMIQNGYNGSRREFQDVVVPYWKQYGIRPQKFWYDIYCAGSDHYDPRFIPDSIWYRYIIRYFNDFQYADSLQNKGLLDRLFPCVKQPETVIKNIGKFYYNANNDLITREKAIELCLGEKELVIKPTTITGGGRKVRVIKDETMTEDDFSSLFDEYKKEFIVQRFVKQHEELAQIHDKSLNTIRVMTFHFQDEIHVLSAQLRMGMGDARIDNVSAGGCSCPIKPDGFLFDKAVTRKSEWLDRHPSGILFRDFKIPNYDRIVEKAKELHAIMPFFNIIGWDFAIDTEGDPVLIEYNVGCEQNQIGNKAPTFGDMTDLVLDTVFSRK